MKKAVVLLSGGMDSAVTLGVAQKDYECYALIFDYGQRAAKEIMCARRIAEKSGCEHQTLKISLPWKGSALLDMDMAVPEGSLSPEGEIPETYVPARNIIFLSFGVSFAEAIGAESVFIGAHQLDYSNYPDCRGEFFASFQEMSDRGTRRGVGGRGIRIGTPVLDMTKKEILATGNKLGVPFEYTWSCYQDGETPCGVCESCILRARAFSEAGVADPLLRQ